MEWSEERERGERDRGRESKHREGVHSTSDLILHVIDSTNIDIDTTLFKITNSECIRTTTSME